jgi:NAD(P)-dependent dehydrogenase (short-subunit alcohol dehydrogenase family)
MTTPPDQLIPVALDVTDTARDAAVVDETVERHGRLDVLVNGAGRTQVGALEETTEAEMRYLFDHSDPERGGPAGPLPDR